MPSELSFFSISTPIPRMRFRSSLTLLVGKRTERSASERTERRLETSVREAVVDPAGAAVCICEGADGASADGAVAGFTGCNDLSGHAAVTGDKIAFTGITTTQKACDAEVTRIERTVLDTLHGSATYRIDGNQLALTNDADPGVGLRLRAN